MTHLIKKGGAAAGRFDNTCLAGFGHGQASSGSPASNGHCQYSGDAEPIDKYKH